MCTVNNTRIMYTHTQSTYIHTTPHHTTPHNTIRLRYITLHYITWHDITLHDITWHYITLQYNTYIYLQRERERHVVDRIRTNLYNFHPNLAWPRNCLGWLGYHPPLWKRHLACWGSSTCWASPRRKTCKRVSQKIALMVRYAIYIYYNNSLTWNKAICGWFLLLTLIPVRSQWVIICPE